MKMLWKMWDKYLLHFSAEWGNWPLDVKWEKIRMVETGKNGTAEKAVVWNTTGNSKVVMVQLESHGKIYNESAKKKKTNKKHLLIYNSLLGIWVRGQTESYSNLPRILNRGALGWKYAIKMVMYGYKLNLSVVQKPFSIYQKKLITKDVL